MPQLIKKIEFPETVLQTCPFCGTRHPILVQGLVRHPEDDNFYLPVLDRGYSFCNCLNIFYTDWSNISQTIYNKIYSDKYKTNTVSTLLKKYTTVYFNKLASYVGRIRKFVELGCITHTILDEARKRGWKTMGVDINPNIPINGHNIKICNVEQNKLDTKTDVIWASHIFEHFKYPLTVAENLYESLNRGGVLFVAMPDPYFINWKKPHEWVHWHLREHHILWDMDSFIEQLELLGFSNVFMFRNDSAKFI